MKKLFKLFSIGAIVVLVMTTSSCLESRKVANDPNPQWVLMTRTSMKNNLYGTYNIDSVVLRNHFKTTAEVSWKYESVKIKTKVDVDENGVTQSSKDRKVEVVEMTLPAGTEGQPVRILRDSRKEITAVWVMYTIKQTGEEVHIWYYATVDIIDPTIIYFASKDEIKHIINGIPFRRVTLDNRLTWKYNRDASNGTKKTSLDVGSPFGPITKKEPVKINSGEEEN